MSDLPTREEASYIIESPTFDARDVQFVDGLVDVYRARADGTLQTRQEFIDDMGLQRETSIVVRRTWGPGDTYQTVGKDEQQVGVIGGVADGAEYERWSTKWEPVAAALRQDTDE